MLTQRHAQAWERLWDQFDMELELASPTDRPNHTGLILHLHIFHLLQTTSPHTLDRDVGVPSRGWHGEAYRGHVFWDELFIFPLLNLCIPDITRALLRYRQRRLDAARGAARAAGHTGAMYPWQSGSDGREETQVVHLNPKSGRWLPDHSQLQRHVNAAIVYNLWQFYQVSGDLEFLCYHGADVILEIARFWASLATFNPELDRYEIRGVMGPDEYHDAYPGADQPGLNNNAYTNLMVVWLLWRALDMVRILPAQHCARIRKKLALNDEEIQRWEQISRKMRLVFHDDRILSQFEGYADLEELDWDRYREKHGPAMRLDRILEAEGDTPNRYKASKQADVQGGTTPEGIHLGAMAGTVDLVQRCYLGLELRHEILWLDPQLPNELRRLRLRLRYRQASLCLDATHDVLKVRAVHCPAGPVRLGFGDRVSELKENEEVEYDLKAGNAPGG